MSDKLLVGSCGNNLQLYSHPNYKLICSYDTADNSGPLRNISWCKDGSWLTVVPHRGHAEIVKYKYEQESECRLLQTVTGIKYATTVAFQRTTKRNLAISSDTGNVLVYDIKLKCIKKQFISSGSVVSYLDWNAKDTHLAAGSEDGKVTLYSNTTNQKSAVFSVPDSESVSVVRFHPLKKNILASASTEGVTAVWDIYANKIKMCQKSHQAPVSDVTFSSQNEYLVTSVALDRTFQCHDLNSKSLAVSILTDQPLTAVDMAPDGFHIAIGTIKGSILVYDLRFPSKSVRQINAHSCAVKKILFQPNGSAESLTVSQDKVNNIFQFRQESSTETSIENKMLMPKEKAVTTEDSFSQALDKHDFANLSISSKETQKKENTPSLGDSFLNVFENYESSNITGKSTSETSNTRLSDSFLKWRDLNSKPINLQLSYISDRTIESSFAESPVETQLPSLSTPVAPASDCVTNTVEPSLSQSPKMSNKHPKSVENKKLDDKLEEIFNIYDEKIDELIETFDTSLMNFQFFIAKQLISQEKLFDDMITKAINARPANENYLKQINELREENKFLEDNIKNLQK